MRREEKQLLAVYTRDDERILGWKEKKERVREGLQILYKCEKVKCVGATS